MVYCTVTGIHRSYAGDEPERKQNSGEIGKGATEGGFDRGLARYAPGDLLNVID